MSATRQPRRHRSSAATRGASLVVVALTAGACRSDGALAPVTRDASTISSLWWLSLTLGLVVYTAVIALLLVPLWRSWRRRRSGPGQGSEEPPAGPGDTPAERHGAQPLDAPPGAIVDEPLATADPALANEADADRRSRARLVWIGGIIAPVVILVVLLLASATVSRNVAHTSQDGELVIEVVGHMFWWEVRYPQLGVTTANEIPVPVDRPVRLQLATEDVIHSFWIPPLHGKVDMIPGMQNQLSFEADETGRFRGQCAEFCGLAHAQMVAFVEVLAPDEFDAWATSQQEPATPAAGDAAARGRQLFVERGCAACHTVRGTAADGAVGPDLTHLASRETIAAGTAPNTRGHLAELIRTPREVKPGIRMPATRLDDEELAALLDYLEALE